MVTQLAVRQMQQQKSGGSVVSITAALVDNPMREFPLPFHDHQGWAGSGIAEPGFRICEGAHSIQCVAPESSTRRFTLRIRENSRNAVADGLPSTVDDIASAVVYLTEARQITGEVLHVDGGAHNGRW